MVLSYVGPVLVALRRCTTASQMCRYSWHHVQDCPPPLIFRVPAVVELRTVDPSSPACSGFIQ